MTNTPDLFDAPASEPAEIAPTSPTPDVRVEEEGGQHGAEHAADAAANHTRELRRLEPIALVVGEGRHHFTAAHVRTLAVKAGILTGEEGHPHPDTGRLQEPRALSYMGALMTGLARVGLVEKWMIDGREQYDKSDLDRANDNKQLCWMLTDAGRDFMRATGMQGSALEIIERALVTLRASIREAKQATRQAERAERRALAGRRP